MAYAKVVRWLLTCMPAFLLRGGKNESRTLLIKVLWCCISRITSCFEDPPGMPRKFYCRGESLLMMLFCLFIQEMLHVLLSEFMWKWQVL